MVYQTEMKVRINRNVYTYPDIAVVCGERQFEDDAHTMLMNPTVIIEVSSPSTEKYDRTEKLQHYRTLPSLQEYVLISQKTHHAERYTRQQDGTWVLTDFDGLDAVFDLRSIGCTLALADVYYKR